MDFGLGFGILRRPTSCIHAVVRRNDEILCHYERSAVIQKSSSQYDQVCFNAHINK